MDGTVAVLPNELALVARAAAEPAAFAAIYDHYFPRVYNYVCYRVGDAETADDLTAQVFERALVKIGHYRPERAPFAAWLFAIARNAVSDYLRARKRRRWLSLEVLRDRASAEPQPEEVAIHKETRAELLAAVACLSDRERDLIALKFAAGLTNRRIAEITGLSESNVGVILYRSVEGWQRRKEYVMRTFFRQRRPAVILAAVVLAATLVVTLAWPGVLTAAAQGIYNVIQRIVLGPNTEAVQIEFQGEPSEPGPGPLHTWTVVTEIGAFGANVLPGVDPTVRSVTDFEEAQELISFHLRAPAYLPEGYTLREVRLVPGNAFLFYDGAVHDIILVQTQVGPQPSSGDPNVSVGVKAGWFTSGTLEEVDLDGRPAAWVDGHVLTWEEVDGISYSVGGLDLSLEEAIRIAESLE